jgi:autotransporter-associated beta strand protein
MMRSAAIRVATLGVIASFAIVVATTANAATTYYWYGADAEVGGSGTWSNSLTEWRTDGTTSTDFGNVAYTGSSGSPNSPYFVGPAGTVTVVGVMYVNTLTLDTADYYFTSTYSGGRTTYQGTSFLTTTYTGTATMNCRMDMASSLSGTDTSTWNIGSGGTLYWASSGTIGGGQKIDLVKTGGGTLLIETDYAIWQGVLHINEGTVSVGNGGATGILSATRNANSSYFSTAVPDCTVASGAYLVFNRSDTYTVTGNTKTGVLYTIAGEGNVVQAGSGMTVFTGDNTYTGPTTISNGTLCLGGGSNTGSIVSDVANNGVLAFNRLNEYTFANAISGNGGVSHVGSGTVTLSGNCSYGGATTVAAGTLRVSTSIASSSSATVTGGALILADGAAPSVAVGSGATLGGYGTAGAVTVNSGGNLGSSSDSNTWGGKLTVTSLSLEGNNNLNFGNVDSYTSSGSAAVIVTQTNGLTSSGGTINLYGVGPTVAEDAYLVQFASSSAVTLESLGLTLGSYSVGASELTCSLQLTAGGGSTYYVLAHYAAGVVSKSLYWTAAANNTWSTATTSPNNWALVSDDSGADYAEGDTVLFDDRVGGTSATVTLGQNVSPAAVTFNNSSSVNYTVTDNGSGYGIGGSATLTLSGARTVTLLTDNTYTGATAIHAGATLQLGDGGTTGSIAGSVVNDGMLKFNHSNAWSFAGVISGSGSVAKTGSGTLTLSGANTYTGTTYVSAGYLVIQGDAATAVLGGTSTDVGAGKLVFSYSDTATGASIASQVKSILTASYNSGSNSWASGVIHSTLANSHSTDSYALGWSNNTATSEVTVKVVLYGDATMDGTVNIYDLGQVLANYNKSGTWATGDFNYDGTVNIYDLGTVLANYNKSLSLSETSVNPSDYAGLDGQGVAALQAAGVNVVPEPGTLALLVAGTIGLLLRAWRKRRSV